MNISEELIKEIVAKVCANMDCGDVPFDRCKLANGMMGIKTATVKCEDFPFDIGDANAGTKLLDVVTLEESPNMGVGIMEMDHAEFPWTLNYDEVEYIIDGEIHLKSAEGTVVAKAGDITYIPNGTSIHFCAPDHVRFLYVSYPADWANQ